MTIDSHQHFWQYDPTRHSWINDEMKVLKQDFLPENLFVELQKSQLDACIAVQADQSEAETNFLLALSEEFDFIKAVVGWVDLRAENLEERLAHFSTFPKLKGFRHVVQDEPDDNFMLQKSFQKGISLLSKYHFTYDILIFPNQMPAALQTIQNFPDQTFVIDHIAKPYIKDKKIDDWRTYISKMAQHQNVFCKVSGMVTEANWQNWQFEDFIPYLDVVFEAFGTDRLMYGSDWPVCLLAGDYQQVKGILDAYLKHISTEEKAKILGGNAQQFYHIEGF